MIKFKVKRLTPTAKLPKQENAGDLFDLFADGFCIEHLQDVQKAVNEKKFTGSISNIKLNNSEAIFDDIDVLSFNRDNCFIEGDECHIAPHGRVLVKTGIAIELPIKYKISPVCNEWDFETLNEKIISYAVADIRPRSGLALKHGITVLNTPGTIDNSYRKEIGVILYNAGHDVYTISKGDKIAQMLIRELAPAGFGEVEEFTGEDVRGGFGSSGKV